MSSSKPTILVRLDRITLYDFPEVIVEAWLVHSPKRLAKAHADTQLAKRPAVNEAARPPARWALRTSAAFDRVEERRRVDQVGEHRIGPSLGQRALVVGTGSYADRPGAALPRGGDV